MDKEYNDPEPDATLRSFFAAELDGQLGRAGRAFQDHLALAHPAAAPSRAAGRRPPASRAGLWFIGVVGSAVAASVVVAATIWPAGTSTSRTPVVINKPAGPDHVTTRNEPGPGAEDPLPGRGRGRSASAEFAPQWEQVEQVVSRMTVDRGLMLLDDNRPGRLVREVAMEQTEWVDPDRGVRMQAFVPRQGVKLIALDTY